MYKDLKHTCRTIVLLVKRLLGNRSRCRLGLLKLSIETVFAGSGVVCGLVLVLAPVLRLFVSMWYPLGSPDFFLLLNKQKLKIYQ